MYIQSLLQVQSFLFPKAIHFSEAPLLSLPRRQYKESSLL